MEHSLCIIKEIFGLLPRRKMASTEFCRRRELRTFIIPDFTGLLPLVSGGWALSSFRKIVAIRRVCHLLPNDESLSRHINANLSL